MRQLLRVTRHRRTLIWLMILALGGCSLPGPYQTYAPGAAAPPAPHPNALVVYGASTTTPENVMDLGDTELTPPPAPVAVTPPLTSPASAPATAQRIAICYSRLWSSADAVHSAAAQACGKGAPRLVSQDTDLDACPTLTPTHAVFTCGP
jgi:hypothetical protein